MKRRTLSLSDDLADQFDLWAKQHGYRNRSEAFRDLLRERIEREHVENPASDKDHCVAAVSYIYNHHERQLAGRLTASQHRHHHLAHSTMHVHLDHDDCLETMVLQGQIGEVRRFSQGLIAEPGVRHGKVQLIPVQRKLTSHHHTEPHLHLRPVN